MKQLIIIVLLIIVLFSSFVEIDATTQLPSSYRNENVIDEKRLDDDSLQIDFDRAWKEMHRVRLMCYAKMAPVFVDDDTNTTAFYRNVLSCIFESQSDESTQLWKDNVLFRRFVYTKIVALDQCRYTTHNMNADSVKSIVDTEKLCS